MPVQSRSLANAHAAARAAVFAEQDSHISQILYSQLYGSLAAETKSLVRTSIQLYVRERKTDLQFSDYSFIVFPMAKAYEGFLKQYLVEVRLLSLDDYHDRRFRIGRALNPDVNHNQRDEQWLYDDITRLCSGRVGRLLWDTWLQCRNQIFHFFPDNPQQLSLAKAGEYVLLIHSAMGEARRCQRQA